MPSPETKNLTLVTHRRRVSGDYEVYGFHYGSEDGTRAWHIMSANQESGEINHYWVVGQDFIQVAIHYAYNWTTHNLIQTFGPVSYIRPEEKEVILDVISHWEATDQQLAPENKNASRKRGQVEAPGFSPVK